MEARTRGDGGPGTRFAIPVMSVGAIAIAALSCGDGAVDPPPPPAPVATTVTVTPGSAALGALGETATFTAEVRDQNGRVMAGAAVAWTTSDASVAAVNASGQVTAAANGSATITATAGSVSGTAAVTVAQVVGSVAVSPAADTLVARVDDSGLVESGTGRIRAILRKSPLQQAAADGAPLAARNTLILVSRGIPEGEMWRR